jgi:hypothetical protein
MRPRLSLRTFLAFAALVALICTWCVLPTMAARQFVRAVETGQFKSADEMFRDPNDRCLEKWDHDCWSFHASGQVATWTFAQLLTGRRNVEFNINYFALDQIVSRNGVIPVTPLGANSPQVGPQRFGSTIIDGVQTSANIER